MDLEQAVGKFWRATGMRYIALLLIMIHSYDNARMMTIVFPFRKTDGISVQLLSDKRVVLPTRFASNVTCIKPADLVGREPTLALLCHVWMPISCGLCLRWDVATWPVRGRADH